MNRMISRLISAARRFLVQIRQLVLSAPSSPLTASAMDCGGISEAFEKVTACYMAP